MSKKVGSEARRLTLQDDHTHGIALAELLHVGEARGALDEHRQRHLGPPELSFLAAGAAGARFRKRLGVFTRPLWYISLTCLTTFSRMRMSL